MTTDNPFDHSDENPFGQPDTPAAAEPSLTRKIAVGAGETAANVVSGALAPVAGGLAGIGTLATNALGLTRTSAADVSQNVSNALTYQPTTEYGQKGADIVAYPFRKLAEWGQAAGEKTQDVTGSPLAATAVETAIQGIPFVVGPHEIYRAIKGAPRAVPEAEPPTLTRNLAPQPQEAPPPLQLAHEPNLVRTAPDGTQTIVPNVPREAFPATPTVGGAGLDQSATIHGRPPIQGAEGLTPDQINDAATRLQQEQNAPPPTPQLADANARPPTRDDLVNRWQTATNGVDQRNAASDLAAFDAAHPVMPPAPPGTLTAVAQETGHAVQPQPVGSDPAQQANLAQAAAEIAATNPKGPQRAVQAIDPEAAHRADFDARVADIAEKRQLAPADIAALDKEHQPLAVNQAGQHQQSEIEPTIERAQQFTKDTNVPSTYLEVQGDHDPQEVHAALQELVADKGHVVPLDNGKDSSAFVVAGAKPQEVSAAVKEATGDATIGVSEIPKKGSVDDVQQAAVKSILAQETGLSKGYTHEPPSVESTTTGHQPLGERPGGAENGTDQATVVRPTGAESGTATEPAQPANSSAAESVAGRPNGASPDQTGDTGAGQGPAAVASGGTGRTAQSTVARAQARIAELQKKSRKSYNDSFELDQLQRNINNPAELEKLLPTPQGMKAEDVQKIADQVSANWKGADAPKVAVHQDVGTLPGEVRAHPDFDASVDAVLHNGTVHLVADNLHSARDVQAKMVHESIGHHGFNAVYGDKWHGLVDSISAMREKPPAHLKGLFDKIEAQYRRVDENGNSITADPLTFAKEAIAHMAESGVKNSITDKAISGLRTFIRDTLGVKIKFSEAELRQMLVKASQHVTGGPDASPLRGNKNVPASQVPKDAAARSQDARGQNLQFQQTAERAGADQKDTVNFSKAEHAGAADRLDEASQAWRDKGTASPFFRKFFGDSKVADAQGNPKVVYHGTADEFNEFRDEHTGASTGHMTAPLGHFFAEDKASADRYAQKASGGVPADERTIAAYMRVENPKEMKLADFMKIDSQDEARALKRQLRDEGYDGIHVADAGKGQWIAFDSRQIKSAENRGTFAQHDPNINFSKAAPFIDETTGQIKPGEQDKVSEALIGLRTKAYGLGVLRSALAWKDRAVRQADLVVDAIRKYYDARPASVRADPAKNYEGIIAYQKGGIDAVKDPVERNFIQSMATLLSEQADVIRAYGEDKLKLLTNYFPQMWEDPKAFEAWAAKRPFGGNRSFTKERVFDDYLDGLKAGFKPKYDNPADALMERYISGEKFVQMLTAKNQLDGLGYLVKDEGRPQQGYSRVNDHSFNGYVVPDEVAKALNNYLAPGLNQFQAWRSFRQFQNTLLASRLGFSAFHAGFTTVDSAVLHLDLAARYAFDGNIAKMAENLGHAASSPMRALAEFFGKGQGSKFLNDFIGKNGDIKDTNVKAIMDALTEGGARGYMDPTDYNNSIFKFQRDLARKDYNGSTLIHGLQSALEGTTHLIGTRLVPAQKMMARVNMLKYELDHVLTKFGNQDAFKGIKQGEYGKIADALDINALRQIAYGVNQRVDERLGQMNYDNLFMPRAVKDIAQATIQSVGWNFGTFNTLVLGARDAVKLALRREPERLLGPLDKNGTISDVELHKITGRLSYLVSLATTVGAMGAISQYLMTGQGPQELRDYFFPKTGNKNVDGSDARISFPSYMKDAYGLVKHPIITAEHKLHPAFSMIAELLNNKDFYGDQVYNPDDKWPQIAEQIGEHLVSGFKPYAAQNAAQQARTGAGIGGQIAPFFGVTPAPGDITHSAFQTYVQDRYYAQHPSSGKTPEAAQQTKQFLDAAAQLKSGQHPDLSTFSNKERSSLLRYVKSDPIGKHFDAMGLQQKLVAYEQATPEERDQYRLRNRILNGKWSAAIAKEPTEAGRQELRRRVLAIQASPR